jgi:glyoxylase-like metal-dependent hydrolase (beta-lactamase superfamily II)
MNTAIAAVDAHLAQATRIVEQALADPAMRPAIASFFDEDTFTVSYVVSDGGSREAALIDSVLDYDPHSGRTSTGSADEIIAHVESHNHKISWLLETHAHADHLSAAPYLHQRLGGTLAIGEHIVTVQQTFGRLFNTGADFRRDGSQFDHLLRDGETFRIGALEGIALHVPGHTPACMAYVIGDAVFVGDTLFMPDYGTARADFPGGNAAQLYRSIRRILALPRETRMFLCHDYQAPGRTRFAWESTVGAQRDGNVHVHDGVSEAGFVAMRNARDAGLAVPRLLLPSVQVNMRAGHLPEPEANGISYIKIPVNGI